MNYKKSKIMANILLGKIFSITGYLWCLFWAIVFAVGITSSSLDYRFIFAVIVLFTASLGIIPVIAGSIIKRRIKRFKNYIMLISVKHFTSLDLISNSVNQSVDFVRKDLQKMIDKKYFKDAHIDIENHEIVIAHTFSENPTQSKISVEVQPVRCPCCGADNAKQNGDSSACEYCGSPL